MQELLDQISEALSGIWRYRWLALVVAWIVTIVGWGYVTQMQDKYLATARVHVDSNSVLRPLLRGLAIQPDVSQRVALMGKTLLSRPNMEKLIRMVDLDLQVKNDAEKDALLERVQSSIKLTGTARDSSLYSISYVHEDRVIAKRVVQSLLSILIEGTLGEKRQDSAGAQEFLDKQIAEYEVRLAEAESRLADFKRKYVGTLPGETGGYYDHLQAARTTLSTAELALNEARNRRNELKRQLAGEEPVFIPNDSSANLQVSRLDGRILSMQEQLDQLLLKYTERHPDVIELKAVLAQLEEEKQAEEEMMRAESEQNPQLSLNSNPVYQQMRTMLAETEARVAELNVRVKEYRNRVKDLESKVDQIPLIEAELQQLNRDYDAVAQQHAQLLKRRESAHLSGEAEQESTDVSFRVIDPPFVPQKPTEPNKLLLNAGVFGLGIVLGTGLALLLSLIRPVFGNRRSLGRVTGFPVLGVVSFLPSASDRRRSMLSGFTFLSLALLLVITFAGVNFLQGASVNIMEMLSSIKAQYL